MLIENGPRRRLGAEQGSWLRCGEEPKQAGAWAGRRLLWMRDKPAFELSFWCGTCSVIFRIACHTPSVRVSTSRMPLVTPKVADMATEGPGDSLHWVRTVGAPRPGDPRDGELHQFYKLPEAFDLEPWDVDPEGVDAHYVKDPASAPAVEDGREVWRYVYDPS